jgi:molybdopterin-guanine dinucleotide biosynthesis protein A
VSAADTTVRYAVIVLAGGAARRLGGADKPGLIVAGRTIIESVVAESIAAGARRVIVAGPPREGLAGVTFVADERRGPVPALRLGLAGLAEPWVAVLAADLPFLRAAHLRRLLRAAAGGNGAVLADDAGQPQWLAGCWRTGTLRDALAGYGGDSLRGLLRPLAPALVRLPVTAGEPPPWLDCDTPEDLARALALSDRSPRSPGPPRHQGP